MSTEPTLGPRTAAGKALLGVDWQTVEHHAEQILRVENEAREQGAKAERERLYRLVAVTNGSTYHDVGSIIGLLRGDEPT